MNRPESPSAPSTAEEDVVLLTVPASGEYLGVLRTATAGLAARLQFTLGEIEDLRIAVDEACGMLLVLAAADAELSCRFVVDDTTLTVQTTVPTASCDARPPAVDSFAWQVLRALTDQASTCSDGSTTTIELVKRRPKAE